MSSTSMQILNILFIIALSAAQSPWGCATNPTNHRNRKSWQEITQEQRNAYLQAFFRLALPANGEIIQTLSVTHIESARHVQAAFLPWHRQFIYYLEEEIRKLPGYECFALPYWDWSNEPTPANVLDGDTLFITSSGVGHDSRGSCVWPQGIYDPADGVCLLRDIDYVNDFSCIFTSPSQLSNIIFGNELYSFFRPSLEQDPHARPHVCIGGQMATFWSPDDPIFYLHHAFVDYLYALWQDCWDYENVNVPSFSAQYNGNVFEAMSFSPYLSTTITPSETFDLRNVYDVSYSKGDFWMNANINIVGGACGNTGWFTDPIIKRIRRRLVYDCRESIEFAQDIYSVVKLAETKNTKSAEQQRKEIAHTWARMVCEYEQLEEDRICERPLYFEDCYDMPRNECNDIHISLQQLISKQGLNNCMIKTRNEWYDWAKLNSQLKYLCAGCFDDFCDKQFLRDKCCDDNDYANGNYVTREGMCGYQSHNIHYITIK